MKDQGEYTFVGMLASSKGLTLCKGSQQFRCYQCDKAVWLSPHSIEAMTKVPKHRVMCIPCMVNRTKEDPPVAVYRAPRHLVERDYGNLLKKSDIDKVQQLTDAAGIKDWDTE